MVREPFDGMAFFRQETVDPPDRATEAICIWTAAGDDHYITARGAKRFA